MKKLIALFLLLLGINSLSFSQSFKKGDVILSTGNSFGGAFTKLTNNYNTMSNGSPLIVSNGNMYNWSLGVPLSAEYALGKKLGIGLSFSASLSNGYEKTISPYPNIDATRKSSSINPAIFGAYHFRTTEKIDIYTRISIGLAFTDNSEEFTNSYIGGPVKYSMRGFSLGTAIGMRRYVSPHFGFFGELELTANKLNSAKNLNYYTVMYNDYTLTTTTTTKTEVKLTEQNFSAQINFGILFKL